ncbi:MAG: hypothetical protein EBQ87_02470 [Planctomycetes bacterium]|nr:hypothetical protein [Planctomycetota bacterium]
MGVKTLNYPDKTKVFCYFRVFFKGRNKRRLSSQITPISAGQNIFKIILVIWVFGVALGLVEVAADKIWPLGMVVKRDIKTPVGLI